MNIPMIPVQSSNLSAYGYDQASKTLQVSFLPGKDGSGSTYQYAGVPPAVWEAFQQADSKGKFLAQSVKGVYPHTKV